MEMERSVSSLQHPLSDPPAPWQFAVGAEGAAGVVSVLMIVAEVGGRDTAQKTGCSLGPLCHGAPSNHPLFAD